jgi:hypothetical protein
MKNYKNLEDIISELVEVGYGYKLVNNGKFVTLYTGLFTVDAYKSNGKVINIYRG